MQWLRSRLGLALALLVLCAGVVWTQTTSYPRTEIFDFKNGFKINGGTTITGTTGSQNSAVVLPPNSVGGGEVSGVRMELLFCGQNDENGTIYFSPTAGVNGATIGARPELASATCDGLDGATEATQDLIVFPLNAIHVMGMYCMTNGTLGASETLTFTMRADAADLTPSITCAIAQGQQSCSTTVGTTTNIVAGAALAMKAVQVSNNSDDDSWCSVSISLP